MANLVVERLALGGVGADAEVETHLRGVAIKGSASILKGKLGFRVGGLISHQFFRKRALTVFRFQLVYEDMNENWFVYSCGNLEIAIHEMTGRRDERWQNKLVFSVQDIEETYLYFKNAKALVGKISEYNGEKKFDITDIQGNDYQFVQKI